MGEDLPKGRILLSTTSCLYLASFYAPFDCVGVSSGVYTETEFRGDKFVGLGTSVDGASVLGPLLLSSTILACEQGGG